MIKTPIALLLNDTHLHEDNVELHRSIWSQARKQATDRGIKIIIHAGDWLVSRKAQTQYILNELGDEILRNHSAGLQTIGIPGNHDKSDYNGSESYLSHFKFHPSFTLIEHPQAIKIDSINFILVPYFDESRLMKDMIEDSKELLINGINWLITHCNFQQFDKKDKEARHYISHNQVECFDKVISGHIHNEWSNKNILHHPSAYQSNFGENERKGFSIIHNTQELEFIQSEFPTYRKVTGLDRLEMLSKSEGFKKAVVSVDVKTLTELRLKYPEIEFENEIEFKQDQTIDSISSARSKDVKEHLEEFCKTKKYSYKRLNSYFQ